MSDTHIVTGQLIDIQNNTIYGASVVIENGSIQSIEKCDNPAPHYLLPGFIDAHVHIESSMLVPSEFARLAVVHGTVGTVSDPHEIGNVLGVTGVEYMIQNGNQVPFKFYFGAPSCVPATPFETAGASIGVADVEQLLAKAEINYLAEMMNWPGVLHQESAVYDKIALAKKYGKVVDGHAPGLKGEDAAKYASAGISTDHECFSIEEALDKLACGMKILIREGSAAKNFEALIPLIEEYEDSIMFCSDDKHPDNLVESHINQLVVRSLEKGYDLFKVLKAACINPVIHYGLDVGLLQPGDKADFIIIDHPTSFRIKKTYINGEIVAEAGNSKINAIENELINNMREFNVNPNQFQVKAEGEMIHAIEPIEGQLITNKLVVPAKIADGYVISNMADDLLKIAVINRYKQSEPAIGFIKHFGLKNGAIASSVAHDSHNVIVIGCDDESMAAVANLVLNVGGGVAAIGNDRELIVPLPVAGLMSTEDGYKVAQDYSELDQFVKTLGCSLQSPFMTLSFMALLVIPSCKLSDKGLFDGEKFEFIKLFSDK